MNGDIWFESTENIASTFSFTAKLLLYFNKYADNKLTPASITSTAVNKNILIVEDNEINMQIACSMLKKTRLQFFKCL